MVKIKLIIIAVCTVLIVGLILSLVIVAQGARIRNFELTEQNKDLKKEVQFLKIKVRMRDEYLQKIKQHSRFKNGMGKIKATIQEWEILKDAERAPVITGTDVTRDLVRE